MIQLTLQYPDQLLVCYRYGFDGRYTYIVENLISELFFFYLEHNFLIYTCAIFFNHLIEVKIKTLLTGKLIQFYS